MLRRRGGSRLEEKPGRELYSLIPINGSASDKESKPVASNWEGNGGGRCERCGLYFANAAQREGTPCLSHPGEFEKGGFGLTWKVVMGKWSCCGSKDEDCRGCRTVNEHLQCQDTLIALNKIGSTNQNSETIVPQPLQEEREPTSSFLPLEAKNVEGLEREGYLRYAFKPGDTLPGIALAHNVTVQDIKRANGIIGTLLDPGYKALWIPLPGTEAHGQSINSRISELRGLAAREGMQIKQAEAKYYLEEDDGDVERALASLRADMAWEKQNAGPKPVDVW